MNRKKVNLEDGKCMVLSQNVVQYRAVVLCSKSFVSSCTTAIRYIDAEWCVVQFQQYVMQFYYITNPLKTVIHPNYTQNFRTNLTEIRIWVNIKEKSINSVRKIIDIHFPKRNTQLHCRSFMFQQVVCCVATYGHKRDKHKDAA